MAFKSATCPECGGALQIPDDKESVKCMYCSAPIIVKEILQVHVKANVQNLFQLANTAHDAGNNNEAYKYYSQILEEDAKNAEAWFGKGRAAGWSSTLANSKIQEMVVSFEKAIELSDEKNKPSRTISCADSLSSFSIAYYQLSLKHLTEFISVDSSWMSHVERCIDVILALELASKWKPQDSNIMEWLVLVCKNNMEGVQYEDRVREAKITKTVKPEYEQLLLSKYNSFTAKIQAIKPDYKPPVIQKKSGSCFVITAVMDDPNHQFVNDIRMIRDNILLRSTIGRMLVSLYYEIGPLFAKAISLSKFTRKMSLYIVVIPLVSFSHYYFRNRR